MVLHLDIEELGGMLIAQVSDIHAGAENDNLQRLEKVVSWLSELRPDCLVVSGDLVDDGWHEGYRKIRRHLNGLACPAFVLPGNSDDKDAMFSLLPDHVGPGVGRAMHFAKVCGEVLLLGLDTTVPGTAHGDVAGHLPWLREQLASAGKRRVMLFTHHHVFRSGIAPIDRIMCRGAELLEYLLLSVPTRPLALCSGHVHRPMGRLFAGIPAYVCGSVCPANPLLLGDRQKLPVTDPPALMVHEMEADRLISHHVSIT